MNSVSLMTIKSIFISDVLLVERHFQIIFAYNKQYVRNAILILHDVVQTLWTFHERQNNVVCVQRNSIHPQSGTKISGTRSFIKDFVPPSPLITMLTNVSFKTQQHCSEEGERGKDSQVFQQFRLRLLLCSLNCIKLNKILLCWRATRYKIPQRLFFKTWITLPRLPTSQIVHGLTSLIRYHTHSPNHL